MGKNTDKLYITHSEWSSSNHSVTGGVRDKSAVSYQAAQTPFWICSISQQPLQDNCGVCDSQGNVFDIRNIIPFLKRSGNINPVTGEELDSKDLIKLHIEKNSEGHYIDPVSYKEFRKFTQTVVIRPSGYVYSEQTVKENNIEPKMWIDLVTSEEFKKSDIIKLRGGMGVEFGKAKSSSSTEIGEPKITGNKRGALESNENVENSRKKFLTTHHMSAGLTSTAMDPVTKAEYLDIPLFKLLKPRKFNETGYATIVTTNGNLNVELYSRYCPKAVYNFIQLAKNGSFNGVKWALSIKHRYLISGKAISNQQSIYGQPFADEIQGNPNITDSRGLLFMENGGKKNNNKTLFGITYARCPDLEGKVTVFGRIVGGSDVLETIEREPVNSSDQPTKSIIISKITVVADPITEQLEKERK